MAVDGCFDITGEVAVERGGRSVLSGKAQRFRKQPDIWFRGANDGHSQPVAPTLDDHFGACPHAIDERGEVI